MITEQLRKTDIFEDLTDSELEDIALFCELKEYYDGEVLIAENDNKDHDLYILVSGEVEVVSTAAGATSSEAVISEREKKDLFGEIGWLTNRKRTATVRCSGPVEVICIDGEALHSYIELNPRVGFCIMRQIAIMLSHNLAETSDLLKQLLWNANI